MRCLAFPSNHFNFPSFTCTRRLNWVRLNHSRTSRKLENRDLKVERADKVTPRRRHATSLSHSNIVFTHSQYPEGAIDTRVYNLFSHSWIWWEFIYLIIMCAPRWAAAGSRRETRQPPRSHEWPRGWGPAPPTALDSLTQSLSQLVCSGGARLWASESIPESQVHRARMWIIYSEWLALWLIIRRLEGESWGRMLFVIFLAGWRRTPPLRLFRFAPHAANLHFRSALKWCRRDAFAAKGESFVLRDAADEAMSFHLRQRACRWLIWKLFFPRPLCHLWRFADVRWLYGSVWHFFLVLTTTFCRATDASRYGDAMSDV